jgi:hypothetical protein
MEVLALFVAGAVAKKIIEFAQTGRARPATPPEKRTQALEDLTPPGLRPRP